MPGKYAEMPECAGLDLLRQMMEKNDFTGLPAFVCRKDGKTVGIAVVDPDGYTFFAKLWCLEVDPGYRGRGIGRMLLRAALDEYDEIKLVAMRNAFGFYRKCGFAFEYGIEPDPKSNVGYMVNKA